MKSHFRFELTEKRPRIVFTLVPNIQILSVFSKCKTIIRKIKYIYLWW